MEKAEELWDIPYDLIDWSTMTKKVEDDVEEEDVGQDNEDIGEEVNEWEEEEEIDVLNNNITEWSDEEVTVIFYVLNLNALINYQLGKLHSLLGK